MKPADRARLTTALREHVAAIAADLRGKLREPGPARDHARQLHADEEVGDDFDVWTDLLSRRAAVLWVLKSVYVRVLEDRGLLAPGRLLDPEAQQLFERLAPNLGETAFLRWIYQDLASPAGGLPELFSLQPAEKIAQPSDERSRALLAFWRHRDADTGAHWSFSEELFEGELMGDLYQELDPVVKDRFALCQTPDFVRAFILDRTLTPALETFGADQVRLLDPACGSGHFLIDGLKRLVAATAAQHKDWSRAQTVEHALARVVGMDLNDYACALARARLVMTAAELAGVTTLAEAAKFHPHVYWADGLEQVERDEPKPSVQFGLFETAKAEEKPRATFTRTDVRIALRPVLAQKFHAVVANPPYITERDPARKEYHRQKLGKTPRYVSAYREYSLGSPFTERCFQLAEKDGYVGIITGNNFMKREFGKPLIEKVLSNLDLTLVADTSQAYIPFHGTPTVLLFGRSRRPVGNAVRAALGKSGELAAPIDPANGRVWSSIRDNWHHVGFENEFVSVTDLPRETIARHPWSLGGGGAADLRERLEKHGATSLAEVSESIGFVAISGADDVFLQPPSVLTRRGVRHFRPMVSGDVLRDWTISPSESIVWPNDESGQPLPVSEIGDVLAFFWPYRLVLRDRRAFSRPIEERGIKWWEAREVYRARLRTPLSIAFAEVATHNHFALDRGGNIFKQTAPVIKLSLNASEADHFALLGLLNSSTVAFWMKQVCHPKGAATRDTMRPESNRYAFASTAIQACPLPAGWRDETVVQLAMQIDALARAREECAPEHILNKGTWVDRETLNAAITSAVAAAEKALRQMVFLQEELDWRVYALYGLVDAEPIRDVYEVAPTSRPFEWAGNTPPQELPATVLAAYRSRREILDSNPTIALIETKVMKRMWRGVSGESGRYGEGQNERLQMALRRWLAQQIEILSAARGKPFTLSAAVAALQGDSRVLAVAAVYHGRADTSLDLLIQEVLDSEFAPSHPAHTYSESGLAKRAAWEDLWTLQRQEDAGKSVGEISIPPEYSQGSRGKPRDFLRDEYWHLRGRLDVPKERFIAFTEVPGRSGAETLYGWAGWTPLQRIKAILAIDEDLDDGGVPYADRIGLLDSAWRLLPDLAREDAQAAARLKAELQALVGPTGPSRESLEDWRKRFPPPKAPKRTTERARKPSRDEEDDA